MDTIDQDILSALAADAKIPLAKLALQMGMARTTIQARIGRMENSGVISGYTVRLGDEMRLNRIRATVLMQVAPRATPAVLARLKSFDEVEVVHTSSGRFDMILELAARTTAALDQVLDKIGAIDGVRSSESLIHLSTKIDRGI